MAGVDFKDRFSIEREYNRGADGSGPNQFKFPVCDLARLESQLESDRGRIINSAAVRRLQQKTQVFPLERNAAVRSRLTHSLEVQQTGRFIARKIYERLGQKAENLGLKGLDRAFETVVEMSCLMHDIGNPPFGHFGEAAISRWFSSNLGKLAPFEKIDEAEAFKQELGSELCSFEGNAQAIRLISRLQKLNLTFVQAASVFKYTRRATEAKPTSDEPLAYLKKKPGYYFSESAFIERMQHALGMDEGCRHPLAYVMEAADDISYCLADLEDAVDKGIIGYGALAEKLKSAFTQLRPSDHQNGHFFNFGKKKSFDQLVDEVLEKAEREDINPEHEFFVWLRVKLIHPLVNHAAQAFIDNIEEVFHGRLNRALLEDSSPCHSVIKAFKSVAFEEVFSYPEVQTLELQGYQVITGLLELYRPLLELDTSQFDALIEGKNGDFLVESRLLKRLPAKHVKAYGTMRREAPADISEPLWEFYCRCRLIQDMVSGMTDQFALDEFRTLSVMEAK